MTDQLMRSRPASDPPQGAPRREARSGGLIVAAAGSIAVSIALLSVKGIAIRVAGYALPAMVAVPCWVLVRRNLHRIQARTGHVTSRSTRLALVIAIVGSLALASFQVLLLMKELHL